MQFIDLKTQQSLIKKNVLKRINLVLKHGQYIMGPEIKELEKNLSVFFSKTSGKDSKNDGHPVPLLNFDFESNNWVPHPTQWYEPSLFSLFKRLDPGASVPSCLRT